MEKIIWKIRACWHFRFMSFLDWLMYFASSRNIPVIAGIAERIIHKNITAELREIKEMEEEDNPIFYNQF